MKKAKRQVPPTGAYRMRIALWLLTLGGVFALGVLANELLGSSETVPSSPALSGQLPTTTPMSPSDPRAEADAAAYRLALAAKEAGWYPSSPLALQLAIAANQQSAHPPLAVQTVLRDLSLEPGVSPVRFAGHDHPVRRVDYSPDGQHIITGANDGVVVWDAVTGALLHHLQGGGGYADYSPNGDRIVTSYYDGIMLWDALTGELRSSFTTQEPVMQVVFSPDGTQIASGSRGYDPAITVRDAATGEIVRQLRGHTDDITALAYSPDGARLVSGASDGLVIVWDTLTGVALHQLAGHEYYVNRVDYSPDGTRILTSGSGESIVWDIGSGAEILRIEERDVIFGPDGREVVVATEDAGTLNILDVTTGELRRTIEPVDYDLFGPGVGDLVLSPDGQHIAGLDSNNYVTAWDYRTGEEVVRFPVFGRGKMVHTRFSATGQYILGYALEIVVWDRWTGDEAFRLRGSSDVVFSLDGRYAAIGVSDSNRVQVLDAATGAIIRELDGHASPVRWLAFHPHSHQLASAAEDDTHVIVWDVATGAVAQRITAHSAPITDVVYRPDGAQLLTTDDLEAIAWDTTTGDELWRAGSLMKPAYSPDSTQIAAHWLGVIAILDAQTGEVVHPLAESDGLRVDQLVFSPDGDQLATAVGALRVWNVETGQNLTYFRNGYPGASTVDYSPDGSWLVTGNTNHYAHILDAHTGELLHRWIQADDRLSGWTGGMSVDFSPDGTTLVASNPYGVPWLWNLETNENIHHLPLDFSWWPGDFALRPDGQVFAISNYDEFFVHDTATGDLLRYIAVDGEEIVLPPVFSAAGQWLVYANREQQAVVVRDVDTGTVLHQLTGHQSEITSLAIDPNGTRIMAGAEDGTILVWDARTEQIVFRLTEQSAPVNAVAFSSNGETFASGGEDAVVMIWDAVTGIPIHQLVGRLRPVTSIAYDPTGRTLAAALGDRVFIWEVASGVLQQTIIIDGYVERIAFSPDGAFIVSKVDWGMGHYTVVADVATGESTDDIDCSASTDVQFMPDGSAFICVSSSSVTLVPWQTVDQLLWWIAEHRYVDSLTCKEREFYEIKPLCDEPGNAHFPTLAPTRTPHPVPQWTPMASPTPSTD